MFPGPPKPERGYKNGMKDPQNRNQQGTEKYLPPPREQERKASERISGAIDPYGRDTVMLEWKLAKPYLP